MNLVKNVINGYLFHLAFRFGFITDPDILEVVHQRKYECATCPLLDKGWCSKKKRVMIQTTRKTVNPLGFEDYIYEVIKGCGCYIKAKVWTNSECPLDKWDKL